MKNIYLLINTLGLAFLIQSCGVAISSSHHDVHYDDYVTYDIYEIRPSGALEHLYGDCINLDDPFDDSGTVHVDNVFIGDDLFMNWDNHRDELFLTFETDLSLIHSTSFSNTFFRMGNEVEFSFGSDYTDFLIKFSGPYCMY